MAACYESFQLSSDIINVPLPSYNLKRGSASGSGRRIEPAMGREHARGSAGESRGTIAVIDKLNYPRKLPSRCDFCDRSAGGGNSKGILNPLRKIAMVGRVKVGCGVSSQPRRGWEGC